MKREEDKMVLYKTNKKNFNQNIIPYLNKIKTKEIKIEKNKLINFIQGGGVIECYGIKEGNNLNLMYLSTSMCSKRIENKLEKLK